MNETNILIKPDGSEDIRNKLQEARDKVTLMEAETKRLSGLSRTLSKDIEAAVSMKAEKEKEAADVGVNISKLRAEETELALKTAEAKSAFDGLNISIADAEKKLSDTILQQESVDAARKAENAEISAKTIDLNDRERTIAKKESDLEAIKTGINNLLKQF